MMTKQAELKKQAYSSKLKSRALSILIYLIDRSNKDLNCFPAIPTMAEQLHISVSTVKRALHELVNTGFIQKDSRFREHNRGQSSNLYTLIFKAEAPELTPNDDDNNPDHGDFIEYAPQTAHTGDYKAEHITFANMVAKQEQTAPMSQESIPANEPQKMVKALINPHHLNFYTSVHSAIPHILKLPQIFTTAKQNAGQLPPCIAHSFEWTGVESILIPP